MPGNQNLSDEHVAPLLDKIANLLGLLAVKDAPQANKIATLGAAGFTPSEIASLIGTTPNTVKVTLSQQKASKKKARPKKKTKSKG